MLVSLKRAAFVTQLRISPTPVIQSSVLTVKKPATWLVIAPLLLLVIFARLQIIWLTNVLLLGPPSLKFFLKMNQTTRRLFVRLTRLWTTMTNLRQFLGSRLAQRLLTSSTKWKAMLLLLLKNSLPPLKMMMIITRIPPNFLTRARKIFHQPLRLTLHYRMDEKPLSTSIVQHQQGSPDSPHSLLAKAANFPMNLMKTLL